MAIICQRTTKSAGKCGEKATLYVHAFGGKAWHGYYCEKHAMSVIRLRMRLIKKYKQNVVVRCITAYDKKALKERSKSV